MDSILKRREDQPEFRQLLLEHFPELREEVEQFTGAIQIEVSALMRLANRCIETGARNKLKEIYQFVEYLDSCPENLSSDVLDAIESRRVPKVSRGETPGSSGSWSLA